MTHDDSRAATAALWGLADYSGLAKLLDPAAAALIDAVAPGVGERVLDVAAGTGNVAVRAAARGAQVTACDLAPRMVQLGRERTGPGVAWIETDAEDLPLPDATVDVALSAFGVIFAPRPRWPWRSCAGCWCPVDGSVSRRGPSTAASPNGPTSSGNSYHPAPLPPTR